MRARLQPAALYAGAFIGPFAGLMTASILPELGSSFGVSAEGASLSVFAYYLPFATVMLVSGGLGERWGASRTVFWAYVAFVAAAALSALAPTWPVFLAGYALAGVANSFTTPLLLATLGRITPPQRIGRTLGLFAAMQGLGQLSAPLFGGLLAALSWRYAFAAVALVAILLCLVGIPRSPATSTERPPWWKAIVSPAVLRYGSVYFVIGGALAGLAFLIALFAADRFGVGPAERGLIVMCGGIASFLVSRGAGWAVDRVGAQRIMLFGLLGGAVALACIPLSPVPAVLAALWAFALASSQGVMIAANKQVLELPGAGGAISVVQALRFFGFSLAPIAVLPLYRADMAWGFWVPALIVGVTLLAFFLRFKAAPPKASDDV